MTFTAAYNLVGLKYISGVDAAIEEYGSIYVTAPEGMVLDISLDGKPQGQTPSVISDVAFGVHILSATGDNYHYESEISVNTKKLIEIVADNSLLKGNLLVRITPADAKGYILKLNDMPVEPGLIKDLSIGTYRISAEGNYWHYEDKVNIENEQTAEVNVVLERHGELLVTVPPDADIELYDNDGNHIKVDNPEKISLLPGDYILSVTHEDFIPYEQKLVIVAGETQELAPLLAHTELFLKKEELATLEAKREKIAADSSVCTVGAITSACICGVSACLSLVFEGLISRESSALTNNYTAYVNSTLSSEAEALNSAITLNKSNIESYRIFRTSGVIGAGISAIIGGVFYLLNPDTSDIDQQIANLREGIE